MDGVLRRYGFSNSFNVEPNGLVGGLMVGWKDFMQVSMKNHDHLFVYFLVTDQTN